MISDFMASSRRVAFDGFEAAKGTMPATSLGLMMLHREIGVLLILGANRSGWRSK